MPGFRNFPIYQLLFFYASAMCLVEKTTLYIKLCIFPKYQIIYHNAIAHNWLSPRCNRLQRYRCAIQSIVVVRLFGCTAVRRLYGCAVVRWYGGTVVHCFVNMSPLAVMIVQGPTIHRAHSVKIRPPDTVVCALLMRAMVVARFIGTNPAVAHYSYSAMLDHVCIVYKFAIVGSRFYTLRGWIDRNNRA